MFNTKPKGIRQRLFLSYSAILLASVMLFAIVLTQMIVRNCIDASLKNQADLTSGIISQLDNFLSEMDSVAISVASNPQLITCFIAVLEDSDPANYFSRNIMDYVDISSLLANINGPMNIADRISVYNDRGDYISAGILLEDADKMSAALSDESRISSVIRQDSPIFTNPHDDYWSRLPNRILSAFRPLGNPYSDVSYGTVEVQRDFSKLERIMGHDSPHQSIAALLYDAEGVHIYSSDGTQTGLKGYEGYFASPYSSGIETIARGSEHITMGKSAVSNWTVVMLQDRSAALKPYRGTFIFLIAGAAALFLILCAVVYIVSDRLTEPLRALSSSILQANLQNFTLNLPDADSDEIQALSDAFKAMFSRLSEASAHELKGHMLALQSQTNPHFLYNMLSVISASAQETGNDTIVDMCAGISALFRYAASHSGSEATLLDELNNARVYLELMKRRYEDDFIFHLNIPPAVGAIKVPKLILLPIIENCFQHGFKNTAPPWRILIEAETTDKEWIVRVADNGAGPDEKALEVFYARLEQYKSSLLYPELELGGMGMLNTAIRLYLAYDKNCVFTIRQADTGGTVVEIGGAV